MKLPTALHFLSRVTPADVFPFCIRCKSKDVFKFEGDIFCNPCGWNSIELRVENQFFELSKKVEEESRVRESLVEKITDGLQFLRAAIINPSQGEGVA